MYATTITQKGQATIPVAIRRKLGIKPGQKLFFRDKGDEIVIGAVPSFHSLRGSLKSKRKYSDQKANEAVGKYLAKRHKL